MYQAAGSGGGNLGLLLLVVVLGGGYLLFIRSIQRKQRNRVSQQQQMIQALAPGAEVVTLGGLYGSVVEVDDESVLLEISDGVNARFDRNAIARVISAGETVDDDIDDTDSDNGFDGDIDDAAEHDADHDVDDAPIVEGTERTPKDVSANTTAEKD